MSELLACILLKSTQTELSQLRHQAKVHRRLVAEQDILAKHWVKTQQAVAHAKEITLLFHQYGVSHHTLQSTADMLPAAYTEGMTYQTYLV